MQSVSVTRVTRRARRASDSPAAHFLARAGLTARGVIYMLIGWVAVLVALGHSSREADQQGALQLLAGKPYGLVSLWLLGIGFAAYALWRLSEAAFGVTGDTEQRRSPAEVAGPGGDLRRLCLPDVHGDLRYAAQSIPSAAGHDGHGHAARRQAGGWSASSA